jgi:broad specificity phosphatase PhoE
VNHLILIKHSLPEVISTIPAREWQLAEIGRLRCRLLAKKIQPYSPQILISSMERKAIETARILAQEIHQTFRIFEDLHEHDRTGVAFLSKEQFEANIQDFFKHPDEFVMGKETANQARQRFSNALVIVQKQNPNKNIAVVSHGTVITLFVQKMTGLEPFSFWKKLDLPAFVVFSLPELKLVTTVESVNEP